MQAPVKALRRHWPEYLMEAAGLGVFMVSAALVTAAFEYPHSSLHAAVTDPLVRRVLIGICMGSTAIGIIYSPWGRRSGAHLNPAVTLTFLRLGKIEAVDACFYVVAQSSGGLLGVLLSAAAIGLAIEHPAVNYVATVPGASGVSIAFLAETCMSFGLMFTVLLASNHRTLAPFTGLMAGGLVAAYISVEAPFSGMSMNPARTFASAVPAHLWTAFWVYLVAPPLGMFAAAEAYTRINSLKQVYCAKLCHRNGTRCIFRCRYAELAGSNDSMSSARARPT